MKNILILLLFPLVMLFGCADENINPLDNNTNTNTDINPNPEVTPSPNPNPTPSPSPNPSPEVTPDNDVNIPHKDIGKIVSLDDVDNAFYLEYKKYVVNVKDEFSSYAVDNIKSFMQNITGRGMMPAKSGIGKLEYKYVAYAVAKKTAENFKISQEQNVRNLVDYEYLNVYNVTFLTYVVKAILKGNDGKRIIALLKPYSANQEIIEKLLLEHVKLFYKNNNSVNENGLINIAYFYGDLTTYFPQLNITSYPNDDVKIKALAKVIYNHCKDKNINSNVINTYNDDTVKFNIETIITCDDNSASLDKDKNKQEFIEKVKNVLK